MVTPIFRNNLKIADVKPLDNSELSQKKQTEDVIRLSFVLVDYVNIKINDYIVLGKSGQKYYITKKPNVSEQIDNYEYECIFEGGLHLLRRTKCFLETVTTSKTYRDYKFPLTGNAETFLRFIIDNLNRNGGVYSVGVFKSTETATVDFNNFNIFEAISAISSVLGFEWYLDGSALNFDKPSKNSLLTLQVGRGLGLTKLDRLRVDSEFTETVVYGYGSTENVPQRSVYDSDLLTENRLYFDGVDGESKVELNTDLYGRIESIQEFDNIKPEFTGAIESLVDTFSFIDNSIDFDINEQLYPNLSAKITMLTGKLIGRTFTINFYNLVKQITALVVNEESGDYPNDILGFSVDDQYKIFNIALPDAYIQTAAVRLETATTEYAESKSKALTLYEAYLDEYYARANSVELFIGDLVRIVSAKFEIDNAYEIKELTQNINNPNIYNIKFGDVIPKSLVNVLLNTNFETEQNIYNVTNNTINDNDVTNIIGDEVVWENL